MNETDRDLRGAKLSKCLRNSELYKETRLSEEERWSLYERLEITAVKVEGLIFFYITECHRTLLFGSRKCNINIERKQFMIRNGYYSCFTFRGVTPEQQMRSRVWPLEWVGKSTY